MGGCSGLGELMRRAVVLIHSPAPGLSLEAAILEAAVKEGGAAAPEGGVARVQLVVGLMEGLREVMGVAGGKCAPAGSRGG